MRSSSTLSDREWAMKPVILVADDVSSVRESLAMALVEAGCEVVTVSNGHEACRALKQRTFDALVCDLWMPGESGIQVLKFAIAECPGIRIVAITGGGPGITMESAASLAGVWGAAKIFLKPFDERQLVEFLLKPNC